MPLSAFRCGSIFLVDDRNTTKSGPPAFRRWRADDGPTLNAGLPLLYDFSGDPYQYYKETLFQDGVRSPNPLSPSGSAHATITYSRPNHGTMRKIHITLTAIYMPSRRHLKVKQAALALPQRDDYKPRKDTKYCTTKQEPNTSPTNK